ncbi:MAG: hypothetical protein NTX45_25120 [Proteobacteria bacterium]|nr:hypothetical protein [Pseudomonadota bacterium]
MVGFSGPPETIFEAESVQMGVVKIEGIKDHGCVFLYTHQCQSDPVGTGRRLSRVAQILVVARYIGFKGKFQPSPSDEPPDSDGGLSELGFN